VRVIDLETRSLCDLRKSGGFVYAEHPTTALLTVAWQDTGGPMQVWLPGLGAAPQPLIDLHLPGVVVWYGAEVPGPLLDTSMPWVGHNAWGFDEPVWADQMRRRGVETRPHWSDSAAMALQSGLPGGLDNLSVRLWGEGKYQAGSAALTKASKESRDPPLATLLLIAKYNCQDVKLTSDLMEHIRDFPLTPFEDRVQWAHRRINMRGVRLDQGLTGSLMRLANEAVDAAVLQIAELTNGFLATDDDLRSRVKVMEWLDLMGCDLGKGKGKKQANGTISRSIAKGIVHQWIDERAAEVEVESSMAEEDSDNDSLDTGPTNLLLVVEVMQLREAALRVTCGKLTAAGLGCCSSGHLRAIIAYFAAGTGRFGGRRFQPQNLPRPKQGVDVWGLLRLYTFQKFHGKPGLPVDKVKALAESRVHWLRTKVDPKAKMATLDDSASALLRAILLPEPGEKILAADLAAIESRVLAWLAGEKWKMTAFWEKKDPYIEFCFKSTGQRVSKKDPLRQTFKVIELGCLAEGSPVLTDSGWVAIESVTLDDKVWDGLEWVQHGGVLYSGEKECLNINGLWMTDDHKVLTQHGWVRAGDLGAPYLSATYSESGRCYVSPLGQGEPYSGSRLGAESVKIGGAFYPIYSLSPATSASPQDRSRTRTVFRTYDILNAGVRSAYQAGGLIVHNSGFQCGGNTLSLFAAAQGVDFTSVGMNGDKAVDLWRDANPAIAGEVVGMVKGRKWRRGGLWNDLMDAAVSACQGNVVAVRGVVFSKRNGNLHMTLPSGRDVVYRSIRLGSEEVFGKQRPTLTYASPRWKEAKLYPGKVCWSGDTLVLTSTGPKAIRSITSADLLWDGQDWVRSEGAAYNGRKAVGVWLEQYVTGDHLILDGDSWKPVIHLDERSSKQSLGWAAASVPSQWKHLAEGKDPTADACVWSQEASTPKTDVYDIVNCGPRNRYTVVTPYGCVIAHNCENLVQAVARDIMAYGLVSLEEAGINVILHVHDEAVCSAKASRFPEFMSLVTKCPPWLTEFPLDAEGTTMPRYGKTPPPGVHEVMYRNGFPLD